MTSCLDAGFDFADYENAATSHVAYRRTAIARYDDGYTFEYPITEGCKTCGVERLLPDMQRLFNASWLNLCRALVPVAARIALDRGLKATSEEEIAMMALVDLHWHSAMFPMVTSVWSPWVPNHGPGAALVCRFCKVCPWRDKERAQLLLESDLRDPNVAEFAEFHWRSCAMKYWADDRNFPERTR